MAVASQASSNPVRLGGPAGGAGGSGPGAGDGGGSGAGSGSGSGGGVGTAEGGSGIGAGVHTRPQRAQRMARGVPANRWSGTSYSAAQSGQAMRMDDRVDRLRRRHKPAGG